MSDEIERLRTEVARQRQRRIDATMALSAADALANTLRALVVEQHDEIVRLRAAGDALAEALRSMTRLAAPPDMDEWVTWQLSVADPALNTYKEARNA